MLNAFHLYLKLVRFDKPIGTFLLFWPCVWGFYTIGDPDKIEQMLTSKFFYIFFLGAFLSRSLGCVLNDMADQGFDSKIDRTKNRPLANQSLSRKRAWICAGIILLMLFFIWIFYLPFKAKMWALFAIFLMGLYPYAKRFTNYPQVILGLSFSTAIPIVRCCLNDQLWMDLPAIFLFCTSVFWVVCFDTIYAFQDYEEDKKWGVKSMAIVFEKKPNFMIALCYFLGAIHMMLFNILLGRPFLSTNLLAWFFWAMTVLFFWNPKDQKSCLYWFKAHGYAGVIGIL